MRSGAGDRVYWGLGDGFQGHGAPVAGVWGIGYIVVCCKVLRVAGALSPLVRQGAWASFAVVVMFYMSPHINDLLQTCRSSFLSN